MQTSSGGGVDGGYDLSVVIPAHNSADVLATTVRRFAERFDGQAVEIIVVENGSTDATAAICADLAAGWDADGVAFVPMQSDKGMGNALRTGALASRGARVLLTADDLPFGFDDVDGADRLARESGRAPAVVIGSKAHPESVVDRGLARAVMTRGFALLRRTILGTRTGDPQGTFVVDGDLLRALAPHLTETGFLFTTELDYAVESAGIRPVEVPIRLSDEHRAHASRISVGDVVQMAKGLLTLRRRKESLRSAAFAAA
ncbi:glycosyltransferase [Rhodococcus sp. TAF43]|uniref:glycosyltransferase n=1 Tax=unclassified Rhodococcus (in: high G+C Gram-positive bacteria) TaxID=192944 RepID=UPI000E0A2E0A|nr:MULTISPECIES: glycosyltransferase [unclassified Rhodococcus (in: high G+C Gram-positive bacteria)]QKT09599.1 glycosyltransferase [Rhodococcus sp. W8901]RDI17214.1 glycosyltransferase involved in cell wall biosynthesis [Rhodococcus sp. AG1013]